MIILLSVKDFILCTNIRTFLQEESKMNFLGIEIDVRNLPELDPGFIPINKFNQAFLKDASKPLGIAVERGNGEIAVVNTFIHGTPELRQADHYYVERLVKTILWMKGGWKVYVCGDEDTAEYLRSVYCAGGQQDFDWDYMSSVFEHPFTIVSTDALPTAKDSPKAIGGHVQGCRIGFDAGGSDRKVSAVIDGETVFSEEVVWYPKLNSDPDYHYDGIVSALKAAAEHLPRVDAVGVSSAGVYINNRTMNASLFLKVPADLFEQKVKNIYIRAITDTFGDVPYCVVNDGDVTALAGAMSLNDSNVLGIAMGTSEAGGFVDQEGRITGWLNELAFMPVDANPDAMRDEWSHDIGCGVKYFSQDGVIKLAGPAGIPLEESLSPAEKLKAVQELMAVDDPRAQEIYRSLGVYLAHALAHYSDLYGFRNVLLLGRVMSGKGGELLLESCRNVLKDEYPVLSETVNIALPDEKFRRVGQSAVAASLPEA